MRVKITAEKVTYRGGECFKGDTPDLPEADAVYFVENGYAEAHVEGEKVAEPVPGKKRGRPRKEDPEE